MQSLSCPVTPRNASSPSRRGEASRAAHRVQSAIYRWGDGGAHFHVWFLPRPLGMIEAAGMMLPLWEDVLPNLTDEELAAAPLQERAITWPKRRKHVSLARAPVVHAGGGRAPAHDARGGVGVRPAAPHSGRLVSGGTPARRRRHEPAPAASRDGEAAVQGRRRACLRGRG